MKRPPYTDTRITEEEMTHKPLTQEQIDKMFSDSDRQIGFMTAQLEIVNLLRDELTIDQIIRIHQLKFKKSKQIKTD